MDNAQGHILGNFHNYYSFHSPEERLKLIPENFFISIWLSLNKPSIISIVDIGCNDGTLTFELHKRACKELAVCDCDCYTLGIDLDVALINAANNKYSSTGIQQIKFQVANISNESDTNQIFIDYLDTVTKISGISLNCFSLVTLFSVTMWIHLNYGDDVLKNVIEASCRWSNHSVIIEPQIWKCYKTAVKRAKRLGLSPFPFPPNQLRINDIEASIERLVINSNYGMKLCSNLGKEIWGRTLMLFCKRDSCLGIGKTAGICEIQKESCSIVTDNSETASLDGTFLKKKKIDNEASS